MTESGTGWPDHDGYSAHANVKLTPDLLAYIEESGESISGWIREACEERRTRELERTIS